MLSIHVFNFILTTFIDKSEETKYKFTEKLQLNKLMLKEDKKSTKNMIERLNFKNVIAIYSFAKTNNLFDVAELSIEFIERCFQMLTETENFSQLDFDCVMKIVSSSELNIHSEVEVFDAVNTWLKHNSEERSKYA